MREFNWAHGEEDICVNAAISWSKPVTHDMLNDGLVESDETAYFYAIIALVDGEWWSFYFGKVFKQCVSERNSNLDHIERMSRLKEKHPDLTWHLTLGTPEIKGGNLTASHIDLLESLLIYSHWHDEIINIKKVESFECAKSIQIENTGFAAPFYTKVGCGVFVSE